MGATNELDTIPRTDLFRTVLSRLEEHVRTLQPGDRLTSDRRLAEELGVSRPLVRQAIKVLEGLGLVQARQGVGTFVLSTATDPSLGSLTSGLPLDLAHMRDVLEARKTVEAAVLRAAFDHRSPAILAQLESSLREQADDLGVQPPEVRLDVRFEQTLGEVCGNEILRRIQSALHQAWLNVQIALEPRQDAAHPYHLDHVQIFEAFRDGDLDVALARLDEHLRSLDR